MRTIPILLIGIGLLAACTTEPDTRPDDRPVPPDPVCAESCEKDADCADGTLCCTDADTCGANLNACVEPCEHFSECENGGACVDGKCAINCASDDDCKDSPDGKICSPQGFCSECGSDLDCQGNAGATACGPEYTCKCAQDSECRNADGDPKVAGMGLCRAEGCVCSSNAGCAGEGPEICDMGGCRICATNADCAAIDNDEDPLTPSPSVCVGGDALGAKCGCADDTECPAANAETGVPVTYCLATRKVDGKDVLAGACVACLTDAQCGAGKVCAGAGTPAAVCECATDEACGTGRECTGKGFPGAKCTCTADSGCAASPAGAACNTTTGACQQCNTDDHCKAAGLGSTCDTATGTCSCGADSECTADKSAPGITWVCE